MNAGEYLKNRQPLVYKSFSYSLNNNRLAHAYIITGEPGVPLKETALFLAQSILCDHPNPLACGECTTCERFVRNEYPDFIFLNGEEDSIKKEEVKETVNLFQLTPLERKGIMVYVIHLVENMTPDAVNSLLKFLEEPTDSTYAILTTQNEDKVLPTILSRCERLRMILTPRHEVYEAALELEVPQEDANILSFFHNDPSVIAEKAKDADYLKIKEGVVDFLEALPRSVHFARYILEKQVGPVLTTKPLARFFFDLLALFFKDVVSIKTHNAPSLGAYDKILAEAAAKLPHVENSLLAIMTLRGEIETNIRISLLLNHLVGVLIKE